LSFLIECSDKGARIADTARPGKGNTLLNYCGIGGFYDLTVDRNPYKHGRFTPGMHIPDPSRFSHRRGQAGYLLVLSLEPEN